MSEITVEGGLVFLTIQVDVEKLSDHWIDDLDAELAYVKRRLVSKIEEIKEGR